MPSITKKVRFRHPAGTASIKGDGRSESKSLPLLKTLHHWILMPHEQDLVIQVLSILKKMRFIAGDGII
jgi:hypothetical protein